jgi:hypothetical protein
MEETKVGSNGMVCEACSTGKCTCGNGMGMMGGWGMHGYRKHWASRKILMLIGLIIVFCLGMQLGELKGEIHGGRSGYGMMRFGDRYGFPGYGMMGAPIPGSAGTTTPAPATPTP